MASVKGCSLSTRPLVFRENAYPNRPLLSLVAGEAEVKPVRPIAYLIGAVYTVIVLVIVAFAYGSTDLWGNFVGMSNKHIDFLVLWFPAVLLLATQLLLPSKLRLSKSELTVVYAMSTLGAIAPTLHGVLSSFMTELGFGVEWEKYLPIAVGVTNPLFVPKSKDIFLGIIQGGRPVPWSAWAIPIAWWSTFLIVQYLLFVTTATLIRRLYIELENLPFPTAMGVACIMEIATSPELGRRRWFLVGVALGVVSTASIWVGELFPGLGIPSQIPYIDLTPLALLPWVPLYFDFSPFYIAAGYLVPSDILLSAVVFYVILFIIIPPIATSMGVFGPFPAGISQAAQPMPWDPAPYSRLIYGFPQSGPGWINWGSYSWGYSSVILGCLYASVLWILFRLRSHIALGLKGFIRSLRGRPVSEDQRFMRNVGVTWIVLLVAYSILLSAGTYWYVPIYVSIGYTLLFLFIYCLSQGLARGYYCDGFGGLYHGFPHVVGYVTMLGMAMGLGAPHTPPQIDTNVLISYSYSRLFRSFGATHRWPRTIGSRTLEMFRLGALTGTSYKSVMISMVIGAVVSTLVAIPLWLWLGYTFGIGTKWTHAHGFSCNLGLTWIYLRQFVTPYMIGPMPWTVWLWYLLGGVLAVLLYILRERWPRFPLHPMGLVACLMGPVMFMPWVIALILRQLTLRVGGFRAYEEKGVPIATGLLCGWAIMLVLTQLVLTMRQIGVLP